MKLGTKELLIIIIIFIIFILIQGNNLEPFENKTECVDLSSVEQDSIYNYKHPEDMSDTEVYIYKHKFRSDMTLADYKNWLLLYENEIYKLPLCHAKNLRKIIEGVPLTTMPNENISVTDISEYFRKLYKDSTIAIEFEEGTSNDLLESNHANYGEFIVPYKLDDIWITGEADIYSKKVNAKELNYYVRPASTTGCERSIIGDIYKKDTSFDGNIIDIPIIKPDNMGDKFIN